MYFVLIKTFINFCIINCIIEFSNFYVINVVLSRVWAEPQVDSAYTQDIPSSYVVKKLTQVRYETSYDPS